MSVLSQNRDRLILVTGATGRQGGAVAHHLRSRGFSVRAFVRDPGKARDQLGEGIDIIHGDLDDLDSIRRALDGAYGVFSIQNPAQAGTGGEVRQGRAVADAAARSSVTHFVYASAIAADQNTGIPFLESKARVERHIHESGLMYTILRPVFFMENWLGMKGIANGIALPLARGMVLQQIAVDDIGSIAAHAFEHPDIFRNRSVDIAGDENSMEEIAATFSRAFNRDVPYREISWEDFERAVGPDLANLYRFLQDRWLDGRGRVDIRALQTEAPELTPFERWVHAQDWTHVLGGRRAAG